MDEMFTPDEVANLLKVPKSTLYSWRYHGTGPKAILVGRHLRYRRQELDEYLDGLGREHATRRS